MTTPSALSLGFSPVAGEFVIARLDPAAPIPSELLNGPAPLLSVTRTGSELSIVCPPASAPPSAEIDGPWCAWYIDGPIPFELTGVVQAAVSPLSARAIPVFVISTFDSDVIMVPVNHADDAARALREAGHSLI